MTPTQRDELLRLCDGVIDAYPTTPAEHPNEPVILILARALKSLLTRPEAQGETAASQEGQLPEFDDLPDDVREEMELTLYATVSDEDHWGSDAAENIYEVVRNALLKRQRLSQEWVTKATSSGKDEPSVLGAGILLLQSPKEPQPQAGAVDDEAVWRMCDFLSKNEAMNNFFRVKGGCRHCPENEEAGYGPGERMCRGIASEFLEASRPSSEREGFVRYQDAKEAVRVTILSFCQDIDKEKRPTSDELMDAWDKVLAAAQEGVTKP